MKLLIATTSVATIVPLVTALTVNTPTSVVQCQPVMLTWSGGSPPYYLALIPGGQVSAAAMKSFDMQNENQLTWVANLAAGTQLTVSLKDSTGLQAYSDMVSVQGSSDTSCMTVSSTSTVDESSPTTADASPDATSVAADPSAVQPGGTSLQPGDTTNTSHANTPSSVASSVSHGSNAAGSASPHSTHSASGANPSATVMPNSAVSCAVSYGLLGALAFLAAAGILA